MKRFIYTNSFNIEMIISTRGIEKEGQRNYGRKYRCK